MSYSTASVVDADGMITEYMYGMKIVRKADPVHDLGAMDEGEELVEEEAEAAAASTTAPSSFPHHQESALSSSGGGSNGRGKRGGETSTTFMANGEEQEEEEEEITCEDAFGSMIYNTPSQAAVASANGLHVVIDGANVGWSFGVKRFDVRGIELVLQYFSQFSANVTCFLPASYARRRPSQAAQGDRGNGLMETESVEVLTSLVERKIITLVPAGGDDDVYALHYARKNEGFIVSNDFFANHIRSLHGDEPFKAQMEQWVRENRCAYTFANGEQIVLDPSSPLTACLELQANQRKFAEQCAASDGLLPPLAKSLEATLASLDSTALVLSEARRPIELKFVLIARAFARREAGLVQGATDDARFILTYLDNSFAPAAEILTFMEGEGGGYGGGGGGGGGGPS